MVEKHPWLELRPDSGQLRTKPENPKQSAKHNTCITNSGSSKMQSFSSQCKALSVPACQEHCSHATRCFETQIVGLRARRSQRNFSDKPERCLAQA